MSNIISFTSQESRQEKEDVIACAESNEGKARLHTDAPLDATLPNDPAEQARDRPAAENVGAAQEPRAAGSGAHPKSLAAADPAAADFAHKLMHLGAAIWCAKPGGAKEFQRPPEWQKLDPQESASRIDNARPGDALCANMGGRVAVVDVDPRNKGDAENVRALLRELGVKIFAEVDTPGIGKHFYIAGHLNLTSRSSVEGLPGVDIQSSGRCVYLPGTQRPTYDGGGYTIVTDQLDDLAGDGDQEGAARFAAWISEHSKPQKPKSTTPAPPWNGGDPNQRQKKYLDTVLHSQSAVIADAEPGTRNDALYRAALKCGSFITGAGMEESEVIAALVAAAEECGLTNDDGERQARDTIRSGLAKGKENPRAVPAPGSAAEGPHHRDADGRQRLEDSYIGEHIALEYLAGKFLFNGAFGWMQFDRGTWISVGESLVGEKVRLGVRDFYTKEVGAGSDTARLKRVSGLHSVSRMKAILTIARGVLHVADPGFDQHPDLLNFRNGVLDLRDGSMRPRDPALRFTKVVPADYKPDAVHEDWEQALSALPADVVDWLQVRLGQGITGHPTSDDRMVILKGEGANGKSTLVDSIREAMGSDYAVTMPDRVLLANTSDHPTELMTLRGARLAVMEELPELGNLNVKRLKATHGTGRISARLIGKDTVTFPVTHSIFVTTNYLPRVNETDDGTWRRLALVNFPYRYSDDGTASGMDREGDPGLRDRLRRGDGGRREAVLAWLVRGAGRWYDNDKVMPELPASVLADIRRWRASADVLLRYIGDRLVLTPDSHVMAKEFHDDFSEWAKDSGVSQWSDQMFSGKFGGHREVQAAAVQRKRGVRRTRPGLSRRDETSADHVPAQYAAWLGVRFRTENDDVNG